MAPIVILGSGLAGYTVAREFRKLDGVTPLVIVTRDDGEVYSKPMLSNALAGGRSASALPTADAAAAAGQLNATVLARGEVASFDAASRTLTLADGERLQFSKLVLALGADPIRVPLEGDAAGAVMQVNDLADYARFRDEIEHAEHVTILGAGLIGCEFANDLVASGRKVDVVDPAGWPLGRLVPERVGRAFAAKLGAAGIALRLGTTAQSVERRAEGGLRVRLSDGSPIDTDAVLSAIGLRPRTQLAHAAGLAVNRGIFVDLQLRTSAPDVFALGDCAEVAGQVLPFVMPLMNAARALAKTLAGEPTEVRYPAMPVVVKTPAAPLTVSPPAPGVEGSWRFAEGDDGSLEATFVDSQDNLLGFALLGGAPAVRQALTKRLPAVLG
ncbi:MAG: FAD-dependent oxidoreductase [Burkholderiales bacterium]|nr:MAG: FAD-dependent oxidoreductase [Burkholderiales bacterium]